MFAQPWVNLKATLYLFKEKQVCFIENAIKTTKRNTWKMLSPVSKFICFEECSAFGEQMTAGLTLEIELLFHFPT